MESRSSEELSAFHSPCMSSELRVRVKTEGVTSMELSNMSLAPGSLRTDGVASIELSLFRAI